MHPRDKVSLSREAIKMIFMALLGHGFQILCLSEHSQGIFQWSVCWGNNKNIENQNFVPMEMLESSWSYKYCSNPFWIFSALSKKWSAIFVVNIVPELCL